MFAAEKNYYQVLSQVVTVTTVCNLWGVSKTNVYYHIFQDNIAAAQCGGTWLIALDSVIAFWGYPPSLDASEPCLTPNSDKRL